MRTHSGQFHELEQVWYPRMADSKSLCQLPLLEGDEALHEVVQQHAICVCQITGHANTL